MAEGVGFEPTSENPENADDQRITFEPEGVSSLDSSLNVGSVCPLLYELVQKWPNLSEDIKQDILRFVRHLNNMNQP